MISIDVQMSATIQVGRNVIARGNLPSVAALFGTLFSPQKFDTAFLDEVAAAMGQVFVANLRSATFGQQFPGASTPLRPSTVGAKQAEGAQRPSAVLVFQGVLADTGIEQRKLGFGRVIVKYQGEASRSSTMGRRGTSAGRVAWIQEFGADITVTDKMVYFFRRAVREGWPDHFLKYRPGDVIHVPARPRFFPVLQSSKPQMEAVIAQKVAAKLAQIGTS